jgi:hypothetical protein
MYIFLHNFFVFLNIKNIIKLKLSTEIKFSKKHLDIYNIKKNKFILLFYIKNF